MIWKFKAKIVALNKVQVVANSIMQNFPRSSLLKKKTKPRVTKMLLISGRKIIMLRNCPANATVKTVYKISG